MRTMIVALLVVAAMVSIQHTEAHALDSKVEASYETGSGEGITVGLLDKDAYALSYTRYLQGLEDNGEPYGAREFLQHPSLLSVALGRTSHEYTPLPPYTVTERVVDEARVSGVHYMGKGRNTGLGLSYSLKESDLTDPGSPSIYKSIKESSFQLAMIQYLTDGLRVGLGYERRDWDYSNDAVWNVYSIDASALIEKYWLSSWYDRTKVENPGGVDHEEMGAELGIYPMRELGVFASYKVLWEMMESTTTFGLRTEYWPSEMTAITLAYFRARVELSHIDEDSGMIRLGLLF